MRLKVDLYKKHSIEVWAIDPDRQEVKVHTSEHVSRFTLKNDGSPAFDGQIIELAEIFKSSV
jgi:Uma2 family endonuclease